MAENKSNISNNVDTATFGAGCFWCVEALYQQLRGVIKVIPGYSGGHTDNPSYREVCMGTTGHAEVCQIIFDPNSISFDELLEVFFLIHDPTMLNQQGKDIGTQYRSIIFYHNQSQKESAEEYISILTNSHQFKQTIVTDIYPFLNFYKAENCHVNYYTLNSQAPYCIYIINPKLIKFKKVFKDKLKLNQTYN